MNETLRKRDGSQGPLRLAVAGLGRMGMIHAQHAWELSRETGLCEFVAVATQMPEQAESLRRQTGAEVQVFTGIKELAVADVCDAVVIATNTSEHREHTSLMLQYGKCVLLEKPLTGTLDGDREFAEFLDRGFPGRVMLGFQRRFDEATLLAKELLESGSIGRLFRVYSALEDSSPAPDRFNSPGILADMGVHNVDEVLWLTGSLPERTLMFGARLHSHRLTTCKEDFDDAVLFMDFGYREGQGLLAEVQVSRNHVSGYRAETVLYGETGRIDIGRFHGNPDEVLVSAYGAHGAGASVVRKFPCRVYSEPLPEFAARFGDAYKRELRTFLECCRDGKPFPVTHRDALRAQEVIGAAMGCVVTGGQMAKIEYA